MRIEEIAELAHEANRIYWRLLGDNSLTAWSDTPDWQKQCAISGVRFLLDNPNSPASRVHDEWLKTKEADGWKYGPVKDPKKKEHPCYVPYEELPTEKKVKDTLFASIVAVFEIE